jgi:hypothetical protein
MSTRMPLLLCLCLCGCSSEPPLAVGLPKPEYNEYSDDYYFDARVKQRFPIGSDEQKLVAELRAEKFKLYEYHDSSGRYDYQHEADYRGRGGLAEPCDYVWAIWWSAREGRLTEIKGFVQHPCL